MDFPGFLAPFPAERFFAEVYDRVPLHVAAEGDAGERRRRLLPWEGLNRLFGIVAQWDERNIQVMENGWPVPADQYVDSISTHAGLIRRADPAKVHALLGMGASLVIDAIEESLPEVRRVTELLADRFLGICGANTYCSFQGIQALRSHCDLHDVFAVHCEGEKVWRIYENRALDPVDHYWGEDRQDYIDRAKGPVMIEVAMRPGDLLYIPRGFYHDAIASSEASLHLTFSVTRHTSRVLFRLLEEVGMKDPAFRAYLPDGREEEGRLLAARLEELAGKIGALMGTSLFRNAIVNRQLATMKPVPDLALSRKPDLDLYRRSGRPAQVSLRPDGAFLVWQGGQEPLGLLEEPARWLLAQNVVSIQQLEARYPQYGRAALDGLIGLMAGAGLLEPRAR